MPVIHESYDTRTPSFSDIGSPTFELLVFSYWGSNIRTPRHSKTLKILTKATDLQKRSDYQAKLCRRISNTIKPTSVGKSQILSSRRLLANLKYYQADDMMSQCQRLSYKFRNSMLCNTLLTHNPRWQQ